MNWSISIMFAKFWSKYNKHIGVFAIIVTAQLAYLLIVHPPLQWFDSAVYDTEAWNFVQGFGLSYTPGIPDALREPGYSMLLIAPIYAVVGHSVIAVELAQVFLSALTGVIILVIAQRFIGRTAVGVIAALLYGLYPGVVVASGEILTETLFTFLILVFTWCWLEALQRRSTQLLTLCGLILGLTTLTRFVALLFPLVVLVVVWCVWRDWKKTLIGMGGFGVLFILTLAPWFARNYIALDHLVMGRTGGGEIYWTGSYIPWDGDWQNYQWPLTEYQAMGLDAFSYDDTMTHLALENIKADPVGVLGIWLKKPLKIYFQPEGLQFLLHAGAFTSNHWLLTVIAIIAFTGHLIILTFVGLGLLYWKKYRSFFTVAIGLLLYVAIIYLPLNAVARYALPVYPLLFLIAAVGVTELIADGKKRLHHD